MVVPAELSVKDVVRAINRLRETGEMITLLAVCPMSEELIRVPIELGVEYDFPVAFVASRNQISEDQGGGYVMGLSQKEFIEKILAVEQLIDSGNSYLRFVSVDHCGPWYKEHEKSCGYEEAVKSVQRTLTACLEAGYSGIHIDCTFAPPKHVEMNAEKIIKLTVDLMEFCEEQTKRLGVSPVSYEIGTEETAGLGITAEHFRQSISGILTEIKKRKLPEPAFVVGRTGARIKMLENVDPYDYTSAASLPKVAGEFDMGFKEHNADYLSSLILSLHPEFGITAANVGPEFAAAQTRALLDLAAIEQRKSSGGKSNLYEIMSNAVLKQAPFHKWLRKGDNWTAENLRNMPDELRAVTLLAGHYVYYDKDVREAVFELYDNLNKQGLVDKPEDYVASAIKKAIVRYVEAFNLCGSASKIQAALD